MKTKVIKLIYFFLIVLLLVLIAVVLFRGKKEDNEVSNPRQETIIQNDTETDTEDPTEDAPSSIELPFVPAGS